MARWKLMTSHYLNVIGEEWEYTEQDRATGRPKRVKFSVPRLLDVNDPSCWTNKWGNASNEEGEIIVCHEGKGESRDIVFFGDPTPDMSPIDEEAIAISASFEDIWKYKPDSVVADHSQSLIDRFQLEMAELKSKPAEVPGLADLTVAIGRLAEQSQAAISQLAVRRV